MFPWTTTRAWILACFWLALRGSGESVFLTDRFVWIVAWPVKAQRGDSRGKMPHRPLTPAEKLDLSCLSVL